MFDKENYKRENSFFDEDMLKKHTVYEMIISFLRMHGVDVGVVDSKFRVGKILKKSEWIQLEITVVDMEGESRSYVLELRVYN